MVTLLTGLLITVHIVFPGPETWWYGLPIAWRKVFSYTPGTAIEDLNWGVFSVDVLFYLATGYVVVIPFWRRHRNLEIARSDIILSLAFAATFVLIVLWTTYYLYTT